MNLCKKSFQRPDPGGESLRVLATLPECSRLSFDPGPAPGNPAQARGPFVAAVASVVCADRQTTIADDPTTDGLSRSEIRQHEQTRRHPRARRQVAGRTEVRLHCRGLATAGECLDADTGWSTTPANGNPDRAAGSRDDHSEGARGAVEPLGQPRQCELPDRLAKGHAERSLGHGHQASGACVIGSIKSTAAPGSSSPATDTLESSPTSATAASRSLAATRLSDMVP